MPNVGLTIEQMQEAVDAVAKYGSQNEAARQLNIPRPTFLNRYRRGVAKGLDQAIVHPAPQGHTVKGVSTMYDAGGQHCRPMGEDTQRRAVARGHHRGSARGV